MNLENKETELAYNLWKNLQPQSFNDIGIDRFDTFTLILVENGDEISETEIREALKDNPYFKEEMVERYSIRFQTLKDMYKLMCKNGYTK